MTRAVAPLAMALMVGMVGCTTTLRGSPDEHQAFGQALRELMVSAGFTGRVLARRLGVSPTTVSRILSGQRGISRPLLEKWLDVCRGPAGRRDDLLTNYHERPIVTATQRIDPIELIWVYVVERWPVARILEHFSLQHRSLRRILDRYGVRHRQQEEADAIRRQGARARQTLTELVAAVPDVIVDEIRNRPALMRVLSMLSSGMTIKQMSTYAQVRESTIKRQVGDLVTLLGAANRMQTLAMCYELGLLGPSSVDTRPRSDERHAIELIVRHLGYDNTENTPAVPGDGTVPDRLASATAVVWDGMRNWAAPRPKRRRRRRRTHAPQVRAAAATERRDERPRPAYRRLTADEQIAVLGRRIRHLRQSRCWLQRDLADRAHTAMSHLSTIETGTANVTLAVLWRIAAALSVHWADLIDERAADEPRGHVMLTVEQQMKAFGTRAFQARALQRITYSVLQSRTRLNSYTIWTIEGGTANLKVKTLIRLAAGLNVHPADLLDDRSPHPPAVISPARPAS